MNRKERIAFAVLSKRKGPDGNPINLSGMSPSAICAQFRKGLSREGRIALSLLDSGLGLDGKRLNLKTLNEGGGKGLYELFEEIEAGEAKIRYANGSSGTICRCAIGVELEIRVGDWILLETKRAYANKEPLLREKNITETGKSNETTRETIVRGLLEELGIVLSQEQLQRVIGDGLLRTQHKRYPSKAFKGIETYAMTTTFMVKLEERPAGLENGKDIKDTNVVIETRWFYKPEDKRPAYTEALPDLKTDLGVRKFIHKIYAFDEMGELPDDFKATIERLRKDPSS